MTDDLPPGFKIVTPSAPADGPDGLPAGFKIAQPAAAANPTAQQPSDESWGEYVGGIARSVAKGATFNWADEIEAVARTSFGGDREMALAKIRDEVEKFQQRHPYVALGSEIAGGVAVPGVAGLKATQAITRGAGKVLTPVGRAGGVAARVGVGAGVGATEGAIGAVGEVEDKSKWAEVAPDGAKLGGVIGAALPLAGAIASPVARGILAAIPDSAPVLGRAARSAKERFALEATEEALKKDAQLSGRTYGQHVGDIRQELVTDRLGAQGTGTASILSNAGKEIDGKTLRVGENVEALARSAGERSGDAQAFIRKAERDALDARPGSAEYDALYARGTAPPAENAFIQQLSASNIAVRQAEAQARRLLNIRGDAVPPIGKYDARLLDYMDRQLRDASEKAKSDRGNTKAEALGVARDKLKNVTDSAFPDTAASPSLGTIQKKYAVGTDQGRSTAKASSDASTMEAAQDRAANDLVQAGVSGVSGRNYLALHGVSRAIKRLAKGDFSRGEALARILTQKTGRAGTDQAAEMKRILDKLENMSETRRSKYIDAMIYASSQQAGKSAGSNE